MQKRLTKDEQFLLALYELALAGGAVSNAVNLLQVGMKIGQNDRGTIVIARDLAQANFIKKVSANSVSITPHGISLVKKLSNAC